jgi:hypothetical protein
MKIQISSKFNKYIVYGGSINIDLVLHMIVLLSISFSNTQYIYLCLEWAGRRRRLVKKGHEGGGMTSDVHMVLSDIGEPKKILKPRQTSLVCFFFLLNTYKVGAKIGLSAGRKPGRLPRQ